MKIVYIIAFHSSGDGPGEAGHIDNVYDIDIYRRVISMTSFKYQVTIVFLNA